MSAGDVVRLKTGGPKMTLEGLNSAGDQANCVWFENLGGGLYQQQAMAGGPNWSGPFRQQFALAALEKVEAKP